MSLGRSTLTVVAVVLAQAGFASAARAADVPTHVMAANANDAAIDATRGDNYVWVPADPARRVGKLLVFLPGGGATNFPKDWTELGSEAARLGYHTLVLAYKNEAPVAAAPPAGCGSGAEASDAPPHCAIDVRMELLDGGGESAVVAVDRANSIENRLNRALQYLVANYGAEGWSRFYDSAGGSPVWPEIVIGGASLGAGEAVLIAAQHTVARVALFHGWTDAKHGWVALGATPSSRYFSLIHARDAFFARTCYAYLALEMVPTCPLPDFTIPPALVDPANPHFTENRQAPYGTRLLVFDLEPFTLLGVADPYHSSTTRDGWIAREADLTPSRKLVSAWRAVLGDTDADGRLDQADNCPLLATGDVADSDGDGIGNACDPSVSTAGGVSATVPATLSLTLGAPASFGAFTPGIDRTYAASTTASVTSTAGDAALSASSGRLANGAFSLAEPVVVTPAKSVWTGPVGNDAFAIAFSQHIGANEALRTGAYSTTVTFTLSTTAP